jgi:hypothetical protein
VIEVPVSVDYEVDVTATKPLNGRPDPRNHRWKLIVNNEDALITNRYRDVSACSKQYVESRSDRLDPDFCRIDIDAESFKGFNGIYSVLSLRGYAEQHATAKVGRSQESSHDDIPHIISVNNNTTVRHHGLERPLRVYSVEKLCLRGQ